MKNITDSVSLFLIEYFKDWDFIQDDGNEVPRTIVFSKEGFLPLFAHYSQKYMKDLFGDMSSISVADYSDALLSTRAEIKGECGSLILCVLIEVIEELCLMKDSMNNKINITEIYNMLSQNKHPVVNFK